MDAMRPPAERHGVLSRLPRDLRRAPGPSLGGWALILATGGGLLLLARRDSGDVSAYAAVGGALIVAVLTWIATDARLMRELRHQHRRDEIAGLRDLFDAVAVDYERARDAILRLARSSQPGGPAEVRPRFHKMQQIVFDFYSAYRRLQVWVPPDEVVVTEFDRMRYEMIAAMKPLEAKQLPLEADALREVEACLNSAHEHFRVVVSGARDYLKRLQDEI